jgi:hypothetical protein
MAEEINEGNYSTSTINAMHKEEKIKWRVVRGKALAESNDLTYRKTTNSLLSVECVLLCMSDFLNCHLRDGERILGIAVNYGEMNATQDVYLEAIGASGSKKINFCHTLLPSEPTRKTRILFRATDFPIGFGYLCLSDCIQNARFQKNSNEHFEISGVLLGPTIDSNVEWEVKWTPNLGQVFNLY